MKLLKFLAIGLLFYWTPSFAFDAQTLLTNTQIQNDDVKIALSQGLTMDFDKTFPSNQYGVYVIVDKAKEKVANKDMIYILLGLCNRGVDGSYSLPLVTISTNLPFLATTSEKVEIAKRLTTDANDFAQIMVQNAAKIKAMH